ncbi:hypothetical protein IscW_ISCW008473 [Ixodes scapularis]|uniref:Uncharacterized protein n=1 Tax=Ixodes scapularis TaxID=6945 RepID=B7PVV3_IXOSC|nr:hypothetical protein IscW_ISCW008473 [Ixodes scapularis]|eukprot:XP_002408697.1 hypothetical protein IscW_ISCW008473 [Ixodes scapularis]
MPSRRALRSGTTIQTSDNCARKSTWPTGRGSEKLAFGQTRSGRTRSSRPRVCRCHPSRGPSAVETEGQPLGRLNDRQLCVQPCPK